MTSPPAPDYDAAYRDVPAYFGSEPEAILRKHADSLPPESAVLDVGCGQGRNALYLAERGIAVDALDPSAEAVAQVEAAAEERGWPVRGVQGRLVELPAPAASYGGVLLFGLFPVLPPAEIRASAAKACALLRPGGLLWATAFTTADPRFEHWRERAVESEGNSFRAASGELRSFLEAGELATLFEVAATRPLEVLHRWEGLGPEHRHGDSPPERHGWAELVLRVG